LELIDLIIFKNYKYVDKGCSFGWFSYMRRVSWCFGEPLVRSVNLLKQIVHGGIVVAKTKICMVEDYSYVIRL